MCICILCTLPIRTSTWMKKTDTTIEIYPEKNMNYGEDLFCTDANEPCAKQWEPPKHKETVETLQREKASFFSVK
ncbi:unnamed protein product [Larinioides sclopetarius]|uniref:Uncharacterized protein n=1 Tax=Larinioides sclopetarius TaxID=280406 RepID=A0AAV2AAC8_9ARAC